MRAVLRAYLEVYPGDIAALFLLSDLQQTSGLREQALETLFDVLGGINHHGSRSTRASRSRSDYQRDRQRIAGARSVGGAVKRFGAR